MQLEEVGSGVWKAPGARIIDRTGNKRLPIGNDGFVTAARDSVLVDKTLLIADVLDSSYKATLFCRPRRFGKTLNMTMLKAFLEMPEAGGISREDAEALFNGTEIWDVKSGTYRTSQGAFPVVHLSLGTAAGETWGQTYGNLRLLIQAEFSRHDYLSASMRLSQADKGLYQRIIGGLASDADYAASLAALCRMLRQHHGKNVVLLIDEYDAPVMAAHTYDYYDKAVSFMRGWLTGAIKDGGVALAFACLTGVQRISKESIFSGLNNLYVSTPLQDDFDERYGFTDAEVQALAAYLEHPDCMAEARDWYDGYRFGNVDVYNPWSVLNYFNKGCTPGAYWGNTSGNAVVGELVGQADADTLEDIYALLEPGGTVEESLDLGVVFPELGYRGDALWSMLYLAGYLTTDDVEDPSDDMRLRPLRIPNREVRRLFRNEVIRRFRGQAGGTRRLSALHRSLVAGDEHDFATELGSIAEQASSFDLTSELPCHMLLMGLLFGVPGYRDPLSNRESGYGRYDIRLEPDSAVQPHDTRPLITVELKYSKSPSGSMSGVAVESQLNALAARALVQIADRGYDSDLPDGATGRLRWGVAFSGKHVAAACQRVS